MKLSTIFGHILPDPFLRLILAVFGGLVASRLCGTVFAAFVPMASSDATALGILLALVLFTIAGVWVFMASTVWRALLGLMIPSFLCGGLLFFQQGGAA